MKVVFRVDASQKIGTGHVIRCLTLANELRRRGANVIFIVRDMLGAMSSYLRQEGFEAHILARLNNDGISFNGINSLEQKKIELNDAQQTTAVFRGGVPDWIVVDNYSLGKLWESEMGAQGCRLVVIDDICRNHDCALLLDQNWIGEKATEPYTNLVSKSCVTLLGPQFALLNPLYSHLRQSMPSRNGMVRTILVFFGGADTRNLTAIALEALSTTYFQNIQVDVVVGAANPHTEQIVRAASRMHQVSVHRDLPNLAALMARADLMLTAGGSTSWERCCLGLPALVAVVAENQRLLSENLARNGAHLLIDDEKILSSEAWAEAIHNLLRSPEVVHKMSARSLGYVDGFGAPRVASSMGFYGQSLFIRQARIADELLYLNWANDSGVRKSAFTQKLIEPDGHHMWFTDKLKNSKSIMFIGEDEFGLPIGQVRFDVEGGEAFVDISVDPCMKRRGIGARLLNQGLERLLEMCLITKVVALVRRENLASTKLFLSVGFRLAECQDEASHHKFWMSPNFNG